MKRVRLLRRIVRRYNRHDLGGESARLAFYAFLCLFPAILVLFAVTGLMGGQDAFDWITGQFERALPREAARYLSQYVLEVTGTFRPGALSIGALLLLWSSSHVFSVMAHALNVIFELEERRRWWRRRGLGLLILIAGLCGLIVAATAVLVGPGLVEALGLTGGLSGLRWPAIAALVVLGIWSLYVFLPNWDERRSKRTILVGAVVGALLWAAATIGFRLYVANVPRISRVYGFVGAVIILQVWLYLSSMTILIGAEVAALLGQRLRGTGDGSAPSGQPPSSPGRRTSGPGGTARGSSRSSR